ncbi:nephrin-like protein [Leptotrombidium deliense]|uniref:Nephrin-like protein n=1 Tax=Leptotrombidium deliense TaxID=299467 RepID=A0A443SWG6_9ACAR|nr:nephrin-like protein [Leptotrombidium deliense]
MTGFQSSIPGYPRFAMIIDADKGLYNLRIHNTQLEDEGEYQCQVGPATNQQPIRASSKLSVIVPVKSLTISGSKSESSSSSKKPNVYIAEVREGEKVILICAASASKPTPRMKWFRKNTELLAEASRTYYNKTVIKDKYVLFTTESSIILYPKTDEQYSCEVQHAGLIKPLRATAFINILTVPEPPIIEGFRDGDAVTVSETLTLTCTSRRGYPPPKVIWYRDGTEVDRSYIITNKNEVINSHMFVVTVDDNQAVYKCAVSNSQTPRPLELAIRLNVLFLPEKVMISGPSEAKLFQTIAVKCTTRPSNPPPRISWFVDGNVSSSGTIETKGADKNAWIVISTLTLTITSKDPSVKTFMCQAESSALRDVVYATHKLTVIYPPNIPTLLGHSEGAPIEVGSLKKYKCTTLSGNPAPTLRWFRKDREISGISSVTGSGVSSELVIRPEREDNGVTYKCEASSIALTHPYEVSFTLNVQFKPTFKVYETRLLLTEGENKVVNLSLKANPRAERFLWRKVTGKAANELEEQTEALPSNSMRTNESTLYIWNISRNESGKYKIEAENSIGESHAYVLIDVHYSASIVQPINVITSSAKREPPPEEGDAYIELHCRIQSNPASKIQWAKEGKEQNIDWFRAKLKEQKFPHFQTSILTIANVSRTDAGTYMCSAFNGIGSSGAVKKTLLRVEYKPTLLKDVQKVAADVRTDFVKLLCEAKAFPYALFNWTVDSKQTKYKIINLDNFASADAAFDLFRSELIITQLSESDFGKFRCVAYNHLGNDFTDIELLKKTATIEYVLYIYEHYIAGVPDSPTWIRCVNYSHDWVLLEWKPGFDGGMEQSFRIRYRKVTHDESPDTHFEYHYAAPGSNRAVIEHLEPDSEYHFTVSGRNKLGESLMSREFVKIKTKRFPPGNTRINSVYASADEHRLGQNGLISENTPFIIGCVVVSFVVFSSLSAFIVIYCQRRKRRETTVKKDAVVDATSDQSPFLISSNSTLQGICNCESSVPVVVVPETREDEHQFQQNKCLYFAGTIIVSLTVVTADFLLFSDYKECTTKLLPLIAIASQPDILMNQIKDESTNLAICCEGQFKVDDCSEFDSEESASMTGRSSRVTVVGPEYVYTSHSAHTGHPTLSTVPEEEMEEVV